MIDIVFTVQMIGRAGRNGAPSRAHLLFKANDMMCTSSLYVLIKRTVDNLLSCQEWETMTACTLPPTVVMFALGETFLTQD